ncbi:hypothetical protein [Pyxidicoccus xibeiensis]|uniref:hypothetical protein n=1 Tax=Pyxidicoccus xibeiensis TaxID=2906759 RepID=UPI0020A6E625|nr:hypothetical protein [Pyxidicoccus xibeiensis]MCP3136177.1 hypothetical protein [Pyxidicoccus xibeiensis]
MRYWAIAAAVLAAGCGSDRPEREPVKDTLALQEPRVCEQFVLTYEESYGECEDDCYTRVEVSSAGLGYVAWADRKTLDGPESKFPFALSAEEQGALEALLADAFTQRWEHVYGCPDCVDQGRYSLFYECNGWASLVTAVDPRQQPEFLRPLIARMRELRAEHRP